MKTYEWTSSIIASLSLIISILYLLVIFYFSKQISKLAQKANEIAEKTYILQQNQLAKEAEKEKSKLFKENLKLDWNEELKEDVVYNADMPENSEKLVQSWENLWQMIIDELEDKE